MYEGKIIGGPHDGMMVKHWAAKLIRIEIDYAAGSARFRSHTYLWWGCDGIEEGFYHHDAGTWEVLPVRLAIL
jgi:hypothetical protein